MRGTLFIVAAPSGAGKSSIVNAVLARDPNICLSISFTSRKPRPGERHAEHYHFVSREEFEGMVAAGDFFEHALSADMAKRLKPAREAYHMAAQRLGVEPADVRMIAAHAWDVTGAMRAGCTAAFVARPGMVLDPAGEQPDIISADLGELADPIIARDRD